MTYFVKFNSNGTCSMAPFGCEHDTEELKQRHKNHYGADDKRIDKIFKCFSGVLTGDFDELILKLRKKHYTINQYVICRGEGHWETLIDK